MGEPVGVLMYTDARGFGGAELHLVDLAAALVGGANPPVALLHVERTDPRLFALLADRGIRTRTAPYPVGKFDVRSLLGLRAELAEHRREMGPFVLHCHQATPYTNHYALSAARSAGVPTVITDHGYYPPTSPALVLRRRLINSMTSHDIAVSRAVAASVIDELGQSPQKVTVVYNGLTPKPPLTPAERDACRITMRARLGIPQDARVVGTVGRQSPEKNLPAFVRTIGALAARDARVRVVLCGQGDHAAQDRLRAIAADGGWADRLILPGRLDDLSGLYASLDVFVLPSLTEGMPLSLMEAMAEELPVAATSVGGVPELVTHEEEGLLVDDPAGLAGLAEAVERLLEDEDLRARMGALGARTVRSRFRFDRTVGRIQQVYDHVARRRTGI